MLRRDFIKLVSLGALALGLDVPVVGKIEEGSTVRVDTEHLASLWEGRERLGAFAENAGFPIGSDLEIEKEIQESIEFYKKAGIGVVEKKTTYHVEEWDKSFEMYHIRFDAIQLTFKVGDKSITSPLKRSFPANVLVRV